MIKARVLIVDDSALVRDLLKEIIGLDPELEVVGEAVNGLEAVEKVRNLRPDIVTMDIEMPAMDGLQAISQIMAENAVPILVVTTRGDAKTAYTAISKGALDLVMKPDISLESAGEFVAKLKLMSKVRVIPHIAGRRAHLHAAVADGPPVWSGGTSDRIVAIASSTGGPDALSIVLSRLPVNFSASIVIAQHISDGFVEGMVGWLKPLSRVGLKVAADGEYLRPGTAYVCPPENHMRVDRSRKIIFVERHAKDIYRPSCDLLLSSVAESFGKKAIGVILTGMGSDGVAGIQKIREAGGRTIAQDEQTSVIFGMPRIAIESGCIDTVLSLEAISSEIARSAAVAAGGTDTRINL
ncbi:MAG: chemotaxis response regulator protein-glutamate methylesterase [Thermodesulfovibrio sp.]|nr:chemotaxis response regulator protein-glutamate methylesterase [Thermodesulfovibrio sp.]